MKTEITELLGIEYPVIQGGMGVGISLHRLAGAVAACGGMGLISTAQIGFEEPDFVGNEEECNLRGIRKHIARAKEVSAGRGMVAVNVMVALQQYREHVKEAVRAGADAVICGAGLPIDLPELVEAGKAKIAPIVSSRRAVSLILKTWDKKYGRTADFIVAEGPEAGGHLGFSREQLEDIPKIRFAEELTAIMEEKKHIRISELAYAVGYNDPRYFSSSFKKEIGMQPSEYMERFTSGGTIEGE